MSVGHKAWMTQSRADQEWREAQADYVSEHPNLSATQGLLLRLEAARRMYQVESRYYEQQQAKDAA